MTPTHFVKHTLHHCHSHTVHRLVLIGAFLVAMLSVRDVCAQQAQWASQYVSWDFNQNVEDVYNVDQEVWLPAPNRDSFWPMQWDWEGTQSGGYLGLQQAGGTGQVRFSVWDATEAQGETCIPFGGEGIGYTCTLPITIDPAKLYRYRLWRLGDDTNPWWGAWLIEQDASGKLTEHYIGKIKAPTTGPSRVDQNSIVNFVEYWGQFENPCEDVPLSIIGFTPPSVNYNGLCTGTYQATSVFGASTKAEGNICKTGKEKDGAIITVKKYNFGFVNGVLVFMGGSKGEQVLNPKTHPAPSNLPDCNK